MPKIKAKFRKYNGIPFAIERLSGTQYRCRLCNGLFLNKSELDRHLRDEARNHPNGRPSKECPRIDGNTQVTVLYTEDWHDRIRKDYLNLPDSVTFDPETG